MSYHPIKDKGCSATMSRDKTYSFLFLEKAQTTVHEKQGEQFVSFCTPEISLESLCAAAEVSGVLPL